MRAKDFLFTCRRSLVQAGFSLISAIFLLVVLAGLGVAMLTISTVQHQQSALDIQGVRAYQAARAGIEWGLYQRLRVLNNTACFSPINLALPAGTSLSGFAVTVSCTPGNQQGTLPFGTDTAVIRATACNIPVPNGSCPNNAPNSSDYVERVVEVRL